MMRVWKICGMLVLGCVSSACSAVVTPQAAEVVSTPTQAPTIIPVEDRVTGRADGAPPDCGPADVARRVDDLVAAINRADPTLVATFFTPHTGEPFHWYSVDTDDTEVVARTSDDLTTHFTQRYAQHEQLALVQVQVNAWEAARGLVHFGPVVFTYQADDVGRTSAAAPRRMTGKGAYNCAARSFVVVSLVLE